MADTKTRTDIPRIVDWYRDGKIAIDPMITPVLKLDEINKGFDPLHAGERIRSAAVY
jgi:S-(hydroxymethyl)glutathione dehydrogenase / alcohol dehydrogenase